MEEEVKRKLIPIDYSDEEQAAVAKPAPKATVALSKDQLTALIASIPTGKDALYLEAVEWETVELANVAETKLRPFIAKKMVEYLGEEEPTLVEHVLDKIKKRTAAAAIEEGLAPVLDDEAAVFVVKLWRMLLFEIKAYQASH